VKSKLDSILASSDVHYNIEAAECSEMSHFEVTAKTQASLPLLKQLESILEAFSAGEDRTLGHDQESTLLCHSFATISGFRQVLLDLTDKVKMQNTKDETLMATCENLRNQIEREQKGEFSFGKMLTGFLGCVSPRSFHSSRDIQGAFLEPIIARLCSKTAFETDGWKRIIPVRRIFKELNLKIDDYELSYEEAFHPNSQYDQQVLDELKASNLDAFLNVMVELGKIQSDTFRKVLETLKKDNSEQFSEVRRALNKRARSCQRFKDFVLKIVEQINSDFEKGIQNDHSKTASINLKVL